MTSAKNDQFYEPPTASPHLINLSKNDLLYNNPQYVTNFKTHTPFCVDLINLWPLPLKYFRL